MELLKPFVESLKQRVSIVDIIGRSVPLKPKGKQFWGCCPFHHEKTPSFAVTEEIGIYKCFGCGEGGDIITFMMRHHNMQYIDAVRELAIIAGVKMPDFKPRDAAEEKRELDYMEIMSRAADIYSAALPCSLAAVYLDKRALPQAAIEKYQIGYAPFGNVIAGRFGQAAIASGLIRAGQDGQSIYDFFRNRLMFPIHDAKGRVIAFSGRSLDGSEPKYINIAETEFFAKRRTLFGLYFAIPGIRERKRAIVVEGQIDAIQMQTNGFPETVAPLGTAITIEHIQILLRYAREIIFCFDGDTAGRKAAGRAAELVMPILKSEHTIKFAFVTGGKDPDDIIRSGGDMDVVLKAATALPDFLWSRANTEFAIRTESGRVNADRWLRAEYEKIPDLMLRGEMQATLKNKTFQEWNKYRRVIIPEMSVPDPGGLRAKIIAEIAEKYADLYDKNFELLGLVQVEAPDTKMSRVVAEKHIQEFYVTAQIERLAATGAPYVEIQALRDQIFDIWN